MKITLDIPDELPSKVADQLTLALQKLVAEELRKVRREFRVGDWVVDCYGQRLYISDIYPGQVTEYELRDFEELRAWKAATVDKFDFPKD
jgi:hypothetical protein